MISPLKIEDVKLIHETELSALVTNTYGRPYQFQQQDGCRWSQDSVKRITVPEESEAWDGPSFAEWIDATAETHMPRFATAQPYEVELWWHREFYPDLQDVMNDLHVRNLLPAGDYAIHIWW